jgi:hypothetical protein
MTNDNGEASRSRVIRLQVMLSADEMRALGDFRFEHRMPSRWAAPPGDGSRTYSP